MTNRLQQLYKDIKHGKTPLSLNACRVFFDFDNTLTQSDVLFDIIKKFSVNDHWKMLEEAWVAGDIGTKECLEGQLRGIRITKKQLSQFLSTMKLDHNCYKIFSLLSQQGIPPVILSDNFTSIIEQILSYNGIKGVKVYANALRHYKDRLIPSFPYDNPFCPSCAHCKKIHLTRDLHENKLLVYIGDGRSDFCPAKVSDIVFAKDSLLAHMKKEGRGHIAYDNIGDVYHYFKEIVDAAS